MEIDHIHFKTAHLSALRAFYTDTFGCSVTNATYEEFTVNFGTTAVTFSETDDGGDPFYHFAINVPQNQFDAATTWLADRVELLPDPDTGDRTFFSENRDCHMTYCRDPADNIVELIARHDLSNDADRPFGSESFRQVSEIGLPVLDKERAVQALMDTIGVSLRDSTDVSTITDDRFITPVGNDRGMFIIVTEGRRWYPTRNQVAEVYPLSVGISDATDTYTFPNLLYRIYPS